MQTYYNVFVRTWWKRNRDWPGGREPGAGRKTYIARHVIYEDARSNSDTILNGLGVSSPSRSTKATRAKTTSPTGEGPRVRFILSISHLVAVIRRIREFAEELPNNDSMENYRIARYIWDTREKGNVAGEIQLDTPNGVE